MSKDSIRQTVNVLALIAVLVVNTLAAIQGINGLDTGDVSDMFQVYFTPAGYVFAIWGLIYLGLIAFTIYQALPGQRDNPKLRRLGYMFALNAVANVIWLFLWHYLLIGWSLLAMVALLLTLAFCYERLGIGKSQFKGTERWTLQIPFSIYFGWITVATIANVTTALYDAGWGGWGVSPQVWTTIVLAVAVVISALVSFSRRDLAYGLVLVWAFVGIAVKHSATTLVAVSSIVAAALVLVIAILAQLRRRSAEA